MRLPVKIDASTFERVYVASPRAVYINCFVKASWLGLVYDRAFASFGTSLFPLGSLGTQSHQKKANTLLRKSQATKKEEAVDSPSPSPDHKLTMVHVSKPLLIGAVSAIAAAVLFFALRASSSKKVCVFGSRSRTVA